MWFYLGIFTAIIATTIRFYQKTSIKSALQQRPHHLIPSAGYKYSWEAGNDKSPAIGYLEIVCKTNIQFAARAEQAFDKWGKLIGLCYECQVGSVTFDDHVYLSSIVQEDADWIGEHASLPKKIVEVLQSHGGYGGIHNKSVLICNGNTLFLKVAYAGAAVVSQQFFTKQKLSELKSLAAMLASSSTRKPHFWKVPTQRNSAILLAMSSSIAIVGALEFIRFIIVQDNDLFEPMALVPLAVMIGITGIGLMIACIISLIKISARRHLIFAEVCTLGLAGLIFASYGWLYDLNEQMDRSPGESRFLTVQDKYSVHHHSRRYSYDTYHLHLAPITPPLKNNLKIPHDLYNRIQVGQTVSLNIKPGYLGHPWLSNISDAPDNQF